MPTLYLSIRSERYSGPSTPMSGTAAPTCRHETKSRECRIAIPGEYWKVEVIIQ